MNLDALKLLSLILRDYRRRRRRKIYVNWDSYLLPDFAVSLVLDLLLKNVYFVDYF